MVLEIQQEPTRASQAPVRSSQSQPEAVSASLAGKRYARNGFQSEPASPSQSQSEPVRASQSHPEAARASRSQPEQSKLQADQDFLENDKN